MKTMPEWVDVLLQHFPDLTYSLRNESGVKTWARRLHALTPPASPDDVIAAIETLAPAFRDTMTPSVLARMVADHRRESARNKTISDHKRRVSSLKTRLAMARPEDRYDIICSCDTAAECAEMERYATGLPGGVVRPDMHAALDALNNEDVGEGYRKLKKHDQLREGDEVLIDREWKVLGPPRHRRYTIYANTVARRAIGGEAT